MIGKSNSPLIILISVVAIGVGVCLWSYMQSEKDRVKYEKWLPKDLYKYYVACKGENDYTNEYRIENGILYFKGRFTGNRAVKSNFEIKEVNEMVLR